MVVRKKGSGFVLKSKKTGKTLGKHKSKAGAQRQERAIRAAQARRGKR